MSGYCWHYKASACFHNGPCRCTTHGNVLVWHQGGPCWPGGGTR